MDLIFGKRLEGEAAERARAEAPPPWAQNVYSVLLLASVLAVTGVFLWGQGWLPFTDSRISRDWFWLAFGGNLILRFGWEWVTGHYRRGARADAASRAASHQ